MNEADSRIMAMTGMKWFRNSYGVIVNGNGWEISKDAEPNCEACGSDYTDVDAVAFIRSCPCTAHGQHVWTDPDYDASRPWSLWHHGEYVGNYATVQDAKADVDTSDCSKCRGL